MTRLSQSQENCHLCTILVLCMEAEENHEIMEISVTDKLEGGSRRKSPYHESINTPRIHVSTYLPRRIVPLSILLTPLVRHQLFVSFYKN